MKIDPIQPKCKIDLLKYDADGIKQFKCEKEEANERFAAFNDELINLQEVLFAEHKQRILIILQAMDTGGKDGIIRHVLRGVNPQGLKIISFKVPTLEELDHDYLWRIHKHTPGRGEIVVFNRSHYEDVLVVRVHNLVPESVWSKRYGQINEFEKMLSEEGTVILKFFLHIDKNEQKERLQARIDEPNKRWKFNPNDLDERKLWNEYMHAYEDMIYHTSTISAPWYAIPANNKWLRNLLVASVLVEKLNNLNMKFPSINYDPKSIQIV